jgi:hypothetical protein
VTFDEELTRVVDRLRSMPVAKLSRPTDDSSPLNRATLARDLAQWMADAAADVAGWPQREIPDVGDIAVGDQLAVTGADLRDVAGPHSEAVLAEAADRLRTLRLTL